MSDLELAIAKQSAKVRDRQHNIRQRKVELHSGMLNFCRKTSTLVSAFGVGAAMGMVYPPRRGNSARAAPIPEHRPVLPPYLSSPLQLFLVNTLTRLFSPTRTMDVENGNAAEKTRPLEL